MPDTIKEIRALATFLLGSYIAYHETALTRTAEIPLLAFAGLCLGLPIAMAFDEIRYHRKNGNGHHS